MQNRNKIETKMSKAQLLNKSLASKLTLYTVFGQSVISVAQSCLTLCDPMDCSQRGGRKTRFFPPLLALVLVT